MGNNISEILNQRLKGVNLSRLAKELGISKSLLADWVSERRLPSLKNIEAVHKIATYLGLTLEQLLLGKEQEIKITQSVDFEDRDRAYRIFIERLK